jgi:purine-binding chemotaxis protein CheW
VAASLSNQLAAAQALRGIVIPPPIPEVTPEEQGEQYLMFLLAGYECAVKAEYIQAVERLPDVTPLPHVAPWITGVMSLRGQIISVVDLRSFLGLERQLATPRTRLLAGTVEELIIGLVVDGVSEMRGIVPPMIQPLEAVRALPAWTAPYASGVAVYGNQSVILLELDRLLVSEKMHQYQA